MKHELLPVSVAPGLTIHTVRNKKQAIIHTDPEDIFPYCLNIFLHTQGDVGVMLLLLEKKKEEI